MKKNIYLQFLILFITIGFFINTSSANSVSVLGPKQYLRTSGSPDVYSDSFLAAPGQGLLVIKNGSYDGTKK